MTQTERSIRTELRRAMKRLGRSLPPTRGWGPRRFYDALETRGAPYGLLAGRLVAGHADGRRGAPRSAPVEPQGRHRVRRAAGQHQYRLGGMAELRAVVAR